MATIDPQKLAMLAQEMDPQPFMAAVEASNMGAISPDAVTQAGFASVIQGDNAPAGGMPPGGMANMMGLVNNMQPKPAQVPHAAAVAPPKPGAMQLPAAAPRVAPVPDLATILGRR